MSERKSCHNCRRRRLRCDRSVPVCYKCTKTGQKCLGYGQLYRWVDSETHPSLGQERGNQQRRDNAVALISCDGPLQCRANSNISYDLNALGRLEIDHRETLNISLGDPLLQDLSVSSRHYLSYFASRFCQDLVIYDSAELGTNPFRELIPMSQTYSYLQHIIIAVSAVHYYHAIRNATSEPASRSRLARNALIDALHARQKAIHSLIEIIQRNRNQPGSQADQSALLATVLFFINFTLIDSGRDGWKIHLTAAGRLLSVHTPSALPLLFCAGDDNQLHYPPSPSPTLELASLSIPNTPEEPLEFEYQPMCQPLTACDYVTSDTVAYFIWNCALESLVSSSSPSPPSSPLSSISPPPQSPDYAAQFLTWDVAKVMRILSRTEANSYHSCPTHLMGIVLRTARLSQYLKTSPATTTAQMDAYLALLREAETFDIERWAAGVSTHITGMLGAGDGAMNEQELSLRSHIAATYRAAVCLYILFVAPGIPAEVRRRARFAIPDELPTIPTTEDLAQTILQQLSFIPNTSPFFKYTVWPVFLMGVDAVSDPRRRWVHGRLRAMRDVCPWGMLTSAMETLTEIWKLRDDGVPKQQRRDDDAEEEVEEAGESTPKKKMERAEEDGIDWLARLQGLKIDCLIV